MMLDRRAFIGSMAAATAAATWPVRAAPIEVIDLKSEMSNTGHLVRFDPVGLFVPPGTTVRWVNDSDDVHNIVAYHPANGGVPLRIPADAKPWRSDYLTLRGQVFERRFDVPGVYDVFCEPHELAGMAGRLVVGEVSGPGAMPFDYWLDLQPRPDWRPVPEAVRRILPAADAILSRQRIGTS